MSRRDWWMVWFGTLLGIIFSLCVALYYVSNVQCETDLECEMMYGE